VDRSPSAKTGRKWRGCSSRPHATSLPTRERRIAPIRSRVRRPGCDAPWAGIAHSHMSPAFLVVTDADSYCVFEHGSKKASIRSHAKT
jgi:hypothetical protein